MIGAVYEAFGQPLSLQVVPDPARSERGVVIEVKVTGHCQSDWHGWMSHDPDISLPHFPGRELAGIIAAIGDEVEE